MYIKVKPKIMMNTTEVATKFVEEASIFKRFCTISDRSKRLVQVSSRRYRLLFDFYTHNEHG